MTRIATLGPDIPQELLLAADKGHAPLGWNIDRAFPLASQWMESKFPPWAFAVLEDWASGALDGLETVVFSRGDDAVQRLYYYVCELQRQGLIAGPLPLLFDVARVGRPSSEAHCIASVRRLAQQLGVGDAALEAAIAQTNALRETSGKPDASGSICVLAGTMPCSRVLHDAVSAAGWQPSGPMLPEVWSRLGDRTGQNSGDPCAALGRKLFATQTGPRGFQDRGAALLDQLRLTGASAVVLWLAEEDEVSVWHLPAQRSALEAAGIPALVLTRRSWRGDDGAGDEIAAFLRGLGQ